MRAISPVKYEFVWGVNVLTIGKRDLVALRDRTGRRPRVTHLFQGKEPVRRAGLYGGTPRLTEHFEGTEY